jgi:hypothetical protein
VFSLVPRFGELLDLKFSLTFTEQYRAGTHANSDNVVAQLLQYVLVMLLCF